MNTKSECNKTGRLFVMSEIDDPISVAEQLRLGRLMFDGAEASGLADRHGLSVEQVEDAWRVCQRALSEHFAETDDEDIPMLSNEELRARGIECLRLLLDWREAALLGERWDDSVEKRGDGAGSDLPM